MRKTKTYPPDLVESVKALYDSGMTQREVALQVGVSQKVIWNLMRRHGVTARPSVARDQRGPKNPKWRGDLASYSAFHERLYVKFGKPKICTVCGTSDPARQYDYANLSGRYHDTSDFAAMCRPCHWRYDGKVKRPKAKAGPVFHGRNV